jgi:hypothetical protein
MGCQIVVKWSGRPSQGEKFQFKGCFEEWSKVTAPMRTKYSQSWLFLLAVIRCYLVDAREK